MGLRYKERSVVASCLLLILFIIITTLLYLPSSDDFNAGSFLMVRDVSQRRRIAENRDRDLLLEKIQRANIIPPPPMPLKQDETAKDEKIASNNGRKAEIERRKEFVKKMTKHAWDGYSKYAWGANELRPSSKTGHSASIFGSGETGASIVDALDTLYLMGLNQEYERAREWVANSFTLKNTNGDMSVFETNIRFVGGLLSAFALTKDTMYKEKASEIAELLLPAFDTPTGIPYALFNSRSGKARNWGWASGGSSILSEFGSLHLEMTYLAKVTNKTVFSEKVNRIREVLDSLEKPQGLYPNYLNPKTGKWGQKHVSVGALGDSFYEYLLKSWLMSNKRDEQGKRMYDEAMAALEKHLLFRSEQNKLAYFAEMKGSRIEHKMDHLACFIGGLLALESMQISSESRKETALSLAKEIGNTCHESYIRTPIGIGPESFRFTADVEAMAVTDREKYYIQRPEVIESWFYLWRATHDEKYRDWCWNATQAIEKYCRTDSGYAGIRNVYADPIDTDDVQQSFLFAETLKYLFLVFSDDDVVPLDRWVFNTEAHPLPVDE